MHGGQTIYTHLNMFSVGSSQRSQVERLAERFAPLFRAQTGFKSVTFFAADATVGAHNASEAERDETT
jgi:hypothetical protein